MFFYTTKYQFLTRISISDEAAERIMNVPNSKELMSEVMEMQGSLFWPLYNACMIEIDQPLLLYYGYATVPAP